MAVRFNVFLVITSFLVAIAAAAPGSAQAWLSGYASCYKITNTTSSVFKSGYQIPFTFNNSQISYADCGSNFNELRFTNGTDCDTDSGTTLNYWLNGDGGSQNETSYNVCDQSNISKPCTAFIQANAANMSSFLVFCNASDTFKNSSGTATWNFYDDFSDNDGSDWTVLAGTWTFSSGYANGTTNLAYLTKNGTVVPDAWVLKYKLMIPSTGGTVTYALGRSNDSGYGIAKNDNGDPDATDIFRRIVGGNANQNESFTCCTVDNAWH
ncbi:MAG: hypothetical protein NTU57_02675, partial [Candidatus Aenigmarchaeota archaeon]|nr:hypothetical protein [Candidatus Aenigmarchaeota archaeon]